MLKRDPSTREIKTKITKENFDSLDFSRSLRDSSRVYQDILQANYDESENVSKLLADAGELGAKVLYPPIMSLLEKSDDLDLIERFIKYLITAYVRHTLIGKKENSLIENLMFQLAKEIRSEINENNFQQIVTFAPNR